MKRISLISFMFFAIVSLAAMRFVPTQIVTAGNMSSATITSIGIDLNQLDLDSIQAVWTGSPVGTLKIQVSNDIVAVAPGANPAANVTHWSDYTGSSTAVSGAGDITYNMTFVGYRWVQLVYTKTSGSGTLNATFSGKGL